MKKFIIFTMAITIATYAQSQSTSDILKQQAGEGVKEGAKVATQEAANKVTDKVLNSIFSKKNKTKKAATQNSNPAPAPPPNTSATAATANNVASASPDAGLQTYSKYDFVPGEKVLVYEDFSGDAIGDFPANWNTNSSGETVTISGYQEHWLMLRKRGEFRQDDVHNLPDNFTYEFDLVYTGQPPFLQLLLATGDAQSSKLTSDIGKRSGVNLGIQPIPRDKGGIARVYAYNAGQQTTDNSVNFQNNGDSKIKISIWRQKERLRMYVNQEKVFDLPHAFPLAKNYNTAMYELWSDADDQSKFMIGNIKVAVGDPDTRNKLVTDGKFSTTGILFDVNSANIKPESYGTLKEIANVLHDNANVKVKIIGHTDSDGDAALNLALSKKRAEAVEASLTDDFGIDGSRMETDGKGASEPVASNTTSAGKAQNRRVEFIKM